MLRTKGVIEVAECGGQGAPCPRLRLTWVHRFSTWPKYGGDTMEGHYGNGGPLDQSSVYGLADSGFCLERQGEMVLGSFSTGAWARYGAAAGRLLANNAGLTLREVVWKAEESGAGRREEVFAAVSELVALGILQRRDGRDRGAKDEIRSRPSRSGVGKVYLKVTNACNLACPTCCAGAGEWEGEASELASGAMPRMVEKIGRLRPESLVITGGEPLLHRAIGDILAAAKGAAGEVVLLTNGTLVSRDLAQVVASLDVKVQISLESGHSAQHDVIRGAGSFERALAGVRRLLEAGARTIEVVATVTSRNVGCLSSLPALARSLGIGWHFSLFSPVGRGRRNLELVPDSSLLMGAMVEAMEEAGGHLGFDEGGPGLPFGPWILKPRRSCGAGQRVLSVDPSGDVYPCQMLHLPVLKLGNVFEPGFEGAGWGDRLPAVPNVDQVPACASCDVRYFCGGGCPSGSMALYGDFVHRNLYCEFFRPILTALVWEWDDLVSYADNLGAVKRRVWEAIEALAG